MRRTKTIDPEHLSPLRWVTVDVTGGAIAIDATLGRHFRVKVSGTTAIEPPANGLSGQRIILRIEWTAAATVSLASSWATRGTVTFPTASGSFYYLGAVYDEEAGTWEAVGIPDLSATYDAAGAAATAASNAAAALDAHVNAADPHVGYLLESAAASTYQAKITAGAPIADPTGGVVVDVEARAAVASILSQRRTQGLTGT